ncbi:MAG TPA: tetratricopeptide repeat protein, partial [Chitinophagales bacterium]|nr:tetratricopeptide repeat protein [Chitinophagales bacterium]
MAPAKNKKLDQLRKTARVTEGSAAIRAMLQLSEHYNRERDKSAFTYARQALQLAIKADDKQLIAKAHLQLAIYFCRLRNDYTTSLTCCEKALQFKPTPENRRDVAEVFKTMGVNYFYLTELQKAQESYQNALNILLAYTDKTHPELKDIADLYYNLAILNRRKENIHLRKENLEKALQYYQQIDNYNGIARCHDGIAVYYFYQKNYRQALAKLNAALAMFEQIQDTEGIYLTCNNIGTLKIKQGKFQEGLDYLHRSLALRKKGRNPVSIAISYINIGNAHSDKKKYKEALENLKQAEIILRKSNSKTELAALLRAMSLCYKNMRQFEKALTYGTEYARLREELHRHEMEKAYNDTIVRHDVELAEKNATIDRLKNFELASYIHRFEMSNNELKQFANAASHDLKEPLRTISSFVHLLEKHSGHKLDATGKEYLKYITGATHRLDGLVKDILSL